MTKKATKLNDQSIFSFDKLSITLQNIQSKVKYEIVDQSGSYASGLVDLQEGFHLSSSITEAFQERAHLEIHLILPNRTLPLVGLYLPVDQITTRQKETMKFLLDEFTERLVALSTNSTNKPRHRL